MNFNDYLRSKGWWYYHKIKLVAWRDYKLLKPYHKHIHCPHVSTFGEVGTGKAFCLMCEREVDVDDHMDDPEYVRQIREAQKLSRKITSNNKIEDFK